MRMEPKFESVPFKKLTYIWSWGLTCQNHHAETRQLRPCLHAVNAHAGEVVVLADGAGVDAEQVHHRVHQPAPVILHRLCSIGCAVTYGFSSMRSFNRMEVKNTWAETRYEALHACIGTKLVSQVRHYICSVFLILHGTKLHLHTF